MSDMLNYSARSYKKCHSFTVTDNFGNLYLFVRSGSRGFFNIAKCEILTDGKVPDRDGLVPGAVPFHAEEVAEIVAQHEDRSKRIAELEAQLEDFIDWKRVNSRKARQKPKRLQKMKKEAAR